MLRSSAASSDGEHEQTGVADRPDEVVFGCDHADQPVLAEARGERRKRNEIGAVLELGNELVSGALVTHGDRLNDPGIVDIGGFLDDQFAAFLRDDRIEFRISDQAAVVVDDESDAVFADALACQEFRQRAKRDVDADCAD